MTGSEPSLAAPLNIESTSPGDSEKSQQKVTEDKSDSCFPFSSSMVARVEKIVSLPVQADTWGMCFSAFDGFLYISSLGAVYRASLTGELTVINVLCEIDFYGFYGITSHKAYLYTAAMFQSYHVLACFTTTEAKTNIVSGSKTSTNISGFTIDPETGNLFICYNQEIRQITQEGFTSTLAANFQQDKNRNTPHFGKLAGMCFDESTQSLLVCDEAGKLHRVLLSGEESTVCEIPSSPKHVAIAKDHTIFVANDNTLFKVVQRGFQYHDTEILGHALNIAGIVVHEASCFLLDKITQSVHQILFTRSEQTTKDPAQEVFKIVQAENLQ